jgi:hypothetical protein
MEDTAMTKWLQWTTAAICGVALSAGMAMAQAPAAKDRQIEQQERIADGVKSGELTKPEARALERNARRIHRSTAKDRRDQGIFTKRERVEAQRKLNRQSRAIAKQKHDRQDR